MDNKTFTLNFNSPRSFWLTAFNAHGVERKVLVSAKSITFTGYLAPEDWKDLIDFNDMNEDRSEVPKSY